MPTRCCSPRDNMATEARAAGARTSSRRSRARWRVAAPMKKPSNVRGSSTFIIGDMPGMR